MRTDVQLRGGRRVLSCTADLRPNNTQKLVVGKSSGAVNSIVVVLYLGWTPHIRGFRSYYGLRILSIREAWPP